MVENGCEKITEKLGFGENSNFIRGSTKAAIRGCSGRNSKENTRG